MALYVYKISDGSLYSWSPLDTDPVADVATLTVNGLAVVTDLPALDASHAWDAPTKTVVSVTPAATPKPLATSKWLLRFTPQEFQVITQSTDASVQQLLFALNHTVALDLSDPVIVNGVGYLVSISLLTQARVSAILAGA